ncbi:MAG: hypothetical protein ABFR50_09420, partial [Candidatus Fermentibacteria bacterium]
MIKLPVWILLVLLPAGTLLADTSYGEISGDRALVFREDAVLFEAPSESSPEICSLTLGAELCRLAAVDVLFEGNGMSCTWLEAVFSINGDTFKGYIPQSWLALTDLALSGDTLFLFGIDTYYPDRYSFVGSARVVSGDEILWESVFYPPNGGFGRNDYSYGVSSRQIDPAGFTGISDLVLVSFSYEACGFENCDVLFAWTGRYLVKGVSASSISEAGLFHYTEELVFP